MQPILFIFRTNKITFDIQNHLLSDASQQLNEQYILPDKLNLISTMLADNILGSTGLFNEQFQQQQSQVQQEPRWKLSLLALFYKNFTLLKKNYCSNICQIITPILCISFTIVARIIAQQITTGQVANFNFPQPFHLPYISKLIPNLHINCTEKYIFTVPNNNSQLMFTSQRLFSRVIKTYCKQSQILQPQFIFNESPNIEIMKVLYSADHETFKRGSDLKANIPDGLIKIRGINQNQLSAQISINDWRVPQYHKNNGVTKMNLHVGDQVITTYLRVTEGLMSLVQKITRSYLQSIDENQIINGFFMYMPFDGQDNSLISKVSNVLGSGLYPLGLCLLMPLFLYNIVSEKQQKLIEIMKMNGLLMKYYWICFFIFNFTLSMISCALLFVLGRYIFSVQFFSHTDWAINWVLFTGWSIAQVSLTTLIQVFINSSKTATIIGYLLSIFSSLLGQTISTLVYPFPMALPLPLLLFPPFALCRGIYLIGFSCANNSSCYQNIFEVDRQMYLVLLSLYIWFIIFIFSTYIHGMVQQQYGTSRLPSWLSPFFKKNDQQQLNTVQLQTLQQVNTNIMEENQQQQRLNYKIEQNENIQSQNNKIYQSVGRVANITNTLKYNSLPLIIKKLTKDYANGEKVHHALKSNTFALDQRQIFGLLGPNGAGKTTLISVLTGLYGASNGQAWIDGKQVGSQQANLSIGVCPQFDLLWQTLTISEHMKFYALLKGVNLANLQYQITELLRDVDLLKERDLRTNQLSGGMRRRLSLAIALIGNPKVVFLDEPSSGLDPSHRRQMWDILLKCKAKTTILLTTHLMEEAEALCDRIGIIDHGLLRCIGTQQQLKQKFGQGYRLTVNFRQWKGERYGVLYALQQLGCDLVNDLGNRIMVKVSKQKMLDCVKKLRTWPSLNWLLSQPSLYDVFMYFVS